MLEKRILRAEEEKDIRMESMNKAKKGYRRKEYEITSEKVKEPLTFVLLADLHGASYGERNQRLIESIKEEKADFVFVAGDMLCAKKRPEKWGQRAAADLLVKLAERTNVCLSRGNHESKMDRNVSRFGQILAEYEEELVRAGILLFHNVSQEFYVKHTKIKVSGLELGQEYFQKLHARKLNCDEVEEMLGAGESEAYHILLAHNPHYGKVYFDWGADLILSGHNHGGVMGFPVCGGVLTPGFRLFDRYTAGRFDKEKQTFIISRGLGDHVPLPRIFNPREYVVIKVRPVKEIKHGN